MNPIRDALAETWLHFRLIYRDGSGAMFITLCPLVCWFFVISMNSGGQTPSPGWDIETARNLIEEGYRRYVDWVPFLSLGTAGMISLGLGVACFAHLMIRIAAAREQGELMRVRTSPISVGAYFAGQIIPCVTLGLIITVVLTGVAMVAGLRLSAGQAALLPIPVVLGSFALANLGIALSRWTPTVRSAQALAIAALLPLMLTSSGMFSPHLLTDAMRRFAELLPMQPLTYSLFSVLSPEFETSSRVATGALVRLSVWSVAGAFAAWWRFRWMPSGT